MRFLNRHILTIGRLFVLLFFLANSGFTVVLYHCTMEEMDCCTTSDDQMSGACSMMDPPQASSGPLVTGSDDCHSVIIAGGLRIDPTVVEKESVARANKVDLVAAFAPDLAISPVSFKFQPPLSTASQNASPSAVETYILNSSFLI
jgi:hypothetical protein